MPSQKQRCHWRGSRAPGCSAAHGRCGASRGPSCQRRRWGPVQRSSVPGSALCAARVQANSAAPRPEHETSVSSKRVGQRPVVNPEYTAIAILLFQIASPTLPRHFRKPVRNKERSLPRLFVSHSSKDNVQALAFQHWLMASGWSEEDVFIDLHGIGAGERWRETLRKANAACEAVLLLASPDALDSPECQRELNLAEDLGKEIIVAILRDLGKDDPRLARWADRQFVDLSAQPTERMEPFEHDGRVQRVEFNPAALASIKARLAHLGIAPDSFAWTPHGYRVRTLSRSRRLRRSRRRHLLRTRCRHHGRPHRSAPDAQAPFAAHAGHRCGVRRGQVLFFEGWPVAAI